MYGLFAFPEADFECGEDQIAPENVARVMERKKPIGLEKHGPTPTISISKPNK
jgi:hypothetical protein